MAVRSDSAIRDGCHVHLQRSGERWDYLKFEWRVCGDEGMLASGIFGLGVSFSPG
jgi:hypothetical protein